MASAAVQTSQYVVRAYPRTPVPTALERHFIQRLGCGYTPSTLRDLRAAGGPHEWVAQQLVPGRVPESPKVAEVDSWFPGLRTSPAQKWSDQVHQVRQSWQDGQDLGNWTILRRIYSRRTLLETMVDFWSNALHVPIGHDTAWIHRFDYDATIRRHALGTFESMLVACALHPAMRLYLDNWRSVRGTPNENQGRELLELHTVTRASGYTEDMVKASAVLLSGYSVDWGQSYDGIYDPGAHTTGPAAVLGFRVANGAAEGRAVTVDYLKYLAHHPATARNVVTKLATYFVSDTPSSSLVSHLAQVYLSSGTDIAATMRALTASDEFTHSTQQKVRTPVDDLVATSRALGVKVGQPTNAASWASRANVLHGGMRLYSWPRPDGAPLTNGAWCSASRMLASYFMHGIQAGGFYPGQAVYRRPASWLPQSSLRFDQYVDHLCRVLLGTGSSPRLLKTSCQATGVRPSATVTARHPLGSWLFARLAFALLDTPDHMTK